MDLHDKKGPILNLETRQAFLFIISVACEAIIACERQLNRMDENHEGGDYGTRLAHGAKAIQDAIQKNEIQGTNLYVTFEQISRIIQERVGNSRGRLYSLFFYNIAKAFSQYENHQEITPNMWLQVLITTNKAIEFEVASTHDQTLLTSFIAMQMDLENALNQNMDPIDAFGVATKAAENFTTKILYPQVTEIKKCKVAKYPDPQAHSVGIWMRGAYEGIKLKLIHYNK